jgi:hypothetical protein
MADLIEKAPPETPVTPGNGVQPPVTPGDGAQPGAAPPSDAAPPEKKPPVDLDARLEEVLAEGRRVAELDKQVAAREKRAAELEAKFGALAQSDPDTLSRLITTQGHLTKKERAAAVKALMDVDEDLLFDLAQSLGIVEQEKPGSKTAEPQLSVEEQVKKILEDRDKAAADKKAEEEKKALEQQQKSGQEQLDTFLASSATYLKANVDKFPFIKAWGCDQDRYTELLIEHAKATGQMPAPEALLAKIEDEHKARWMKGPYAPKEPPPLEDLDAHVARTYQQAKPPPGTAEPPPPRKLTAYEEAKRDLEAFDREQRERIRYGQT